MMNRQRAATVTAALLLAAWCGAAAGESGQKCTYSTQECLNHMSAKMKATGWIGIEYDMDDPGGTAKITKVLPGSPAEKAGLQVNDLLIALNGVELMKKQNEAALQKARKEWKPGQTVTYTIKRAGVSHQIPLVLGEWPADLLARYIGSHMLEHAEADAATAHHPPPK